MFSGFSSLFRQQNITWRVNHSVHWSVTKSKRRQIPDNKERCVCCVCVPRIRPRDLVAALDSIRRADAMNGHVFRSRQPVASAPTHILDTFFKCFNQTWAQIGRFGRWKKFYLERWRWVSLCWTGLALKVWTEQQPSKSSRKRPNNRSCPFRCQFPLWSLPKTQFKETGQSTNSKTSAAFDCPRKREHCSCKLNWNFGNRLEINKHGWFFFFAQSAGIQVQFSAASLLQWIRPNGIQFRLFTLGNDPLERLK